METAVSAVLHKAGDVPVCSLLTPTVHWDNVPHHGTGQASCAAARREKEFNMCGAAWRGALVRVSVLWAICAGAAEQQTVYVVNTASEDGMVEAGVPAAIELPEGAVAVAGDYRTAIIGNGKRRSFILPMKAMTTLAVGLQAGQAPDSPQIRHCDAALSLLFSGCPAVAHL